MSGFEYHLRCPACGYASPVMRLGKDHPAGATAMVNENAIELGPAVVPLLLRELERRPNHWFAALRALTGADPVAPADRGRLGVMAEAWIKWGKERGYL